MKTLTEEVSVIIVCSECGCQRTIKAKEIPIGDCKFCEKEFGYYFFPGQELDKDGCLDNSGSVIDSFQKGDVITLNTRIPADNPKRIQKVERNGVILYKEEA